MNGSNKICGAILVLAGCVLFNSDYGDYEFYAILLNAFGLLLVLGSLLLQMFPRLGAKLRSIRNEIQDEIERQNSYLIDDQSRWPNEDSTEPKSE